MWSIPLAALIICAPFAWAFWLKRQAACLRHADKVWGDVEYHARILLDDRTLPPVVGDFIESLILDVGNGSLTRNFVLSLLRPSKDDEDDEVDEAIRDMAEGQHAHFLRLAVLALFYDSLRAGLAGMFLRRFAMYWLNATATDRKAIVTDAQVAPIIRVAEHQYCPA